MFKFFKNSKKEKRLRRIEEELSSQGRSLCFTSTYRRQIELEDRVSSLENEIKLMQIFNDNSISKIFPFQEREVENEDEEFCYSTNYYINGAEVNLKAKYTGGETSFYVKGKESLGVVLTIPFKIEGVSKQFIEILDWGEDDEDYWRGKFNY